MIDIKYLKIKDKQIVIYQINGKWINLSDNKRWINLTKDLWISDNSATNDSIGAREVKISK